VNCFHALNNDCSAQDRRTESILLWLETSGHEDPEDVITIVLYPEKEVCADPVDGGAILGEGGGKLPSSDKERQLAPDIGRGKT
jgi:hypothetical protein